MKIKILKNGMWECRVVNSTKEMKEIAQSGCDFEYIV